VRFAVALSLSFSAGEIAELREVSAERGDDRGTVPQMRVNFLGLTGPMGVLPTHYTELQMQRVREKDTALRDFFDVLNHRTISLFYRAWEKYRLPSSFERHQITGMPHGSADPISRALQGLIGHLVDRQQTKLHVPLEHLLYYTGLFSGGRRSAAALEMLLGEYFDIPIRVEQFRGQWWPLSANDQVRLPHAWEAEGKNNCLGVDTVIGEEAFSVDAGVQIVLGPLSRQQFADISPGGARIKALFQLAQLFAGPTFEFSLCYEVDKEAVPPAHLGEEAPVGLALGWGACLVETDGGELGSGKQHVRFYVDAA
jgi:type VI secretion system protein ImpH